MAPMSTMNGRRVTILGTGRYFLHTTATVSGLMVGGMCAADKGGIGGV
jgi:hypothetical protein